MKLSIPAILLLAVAQAVAAPRWEIQYRYQNPDSQLTLADLAFPSAERGIACGAIAPRRGAPRPVALVTSDGGAQWTEVALRETCLSLFFVDDSTGWMVTDRGIWSSLESGRSWSKLVNAPSGISKTWFTDRRHGYAIGSRKRVFETRDAGDSWTLLPIVNEVQGDPNYTGFNEIVFSGNNGLITGFSLPPRTAPPRGEKNPEIPRLTVMLETRDAGKTWRRNDVALFGQITQVALAPHGAGLGLIEFKDDFDFPFEIYRLNLFNGRNDRVLRRKDRVITAVRLFPGSVQAMVAGYEISGPVFRGMVPGKLKVLTTTDYENWDEMDVDPQVVAHKAIFAGPDETSLWIATDTGVILRLAR